MGVGGGSCSGGRVVGWRLQDSGRRRREEGVGGGRCVGNRSRFPVVVLRAVVADWLSRVGAVHGGVWRRKEEVMMMLAGAGTSTFVLEWAMSLLLNHPDAMRKVRAEIDEQVGHERLVNESDLPKLPYLKCVINETLRLYPILPVLLPHFSSQSCTVGGFEIPAGTILMANIWAMHRDPKVWEEPGEFKPERFEAASQEPRSSKFAPFGMGRRACPGATMGMHITSLPLGALVQCFEWEKIGLQEDMDCFPGFPLFKKKPLHALCTPRQSLVNLLSQI
ncbi:hypothetical protein Tsubulata_017657 [Turnera subulata]|uniref:Cytochrome P450 n=1 Tax=Turnera subulata TaxID=218843 RepID=A0A9Q0IZY7_9ROSI|nr:hypothetical protein Tsubulata_017657 [Turnera subulata]